MIYSSACEYAIRAASYLASRHGAESGRVKLREIAEAEDLPSPFLSAVLNKLVAAGLLESTRGPTGGYALRRPPSELTLHDIKAAVDGVAELDACAAGRAVCSDETPCPLHDAWKPIRERIRRYLEETTLADMAAAVEKKKAASAGADGAEPEGGVPASHPRP